MAEHNSTENSILDKSSDIVNQVVEVSKDTSIKNVSKLIQSLLGEEKEKIQTHLYLKHLQEKVENKGDGNIHIPKVSKIKRDAEYIHIPDVLQSVIELINNIAPGTKSIIDVTNSLINMLIGDDVKGVGYFLTQEAQQVIKSNSYEDLVIAKNAISEDLTALRSIEKDHDKWKDKMKLSILYTAFDKAIFEHDQNQHNTLKNTEKQEKPAENKSILSKKLEYLESRLQAGDILYANEPNEKKSWLKNLTVNLAKPAMVDAKDSRDFTSIHAAVYVGNGKIRHIQRGKDGEISKKELSLREFFTENKDNEALYASIAVGRLHLSEPVQKLFAHTVIEKSNETKEYSTLEAGNAGIHGLFNSATSLNTDDTSLICTDLPRISALRILENLDENNTIQIDKTGLIIRKSKKNKINFDTQKPEKQEENTIHLSSSDINELKKLVNSNGTFQMFSNFAAPIAMNIQDFTIDETTKTKNTKNNTDNNKKITTGDVSETIETAKK